MDRNEHQGILDQLLTMVTPENQANASELLVQLADGFNGVFTSNEDLTATNEKLTTDNERLRKVNTDLFLKVGEPNKDEKTPTQKKIEQEENKLPFEDLFNEKGDLK